MLFISRTVYSTTGASRDKYEQYCKALDSEKNQIQNKRELTTKKNDSPGQGTARSMGGTSEQINIV